MARVIREHVVGTEEKFNECISRGLYRGLVMIDNASVYWGQDGILLLTTTQEWSDYLHGKTDELPSTMEFEPDLNDESLLTLLTGGAQ